MQCSLMTSEVYCVFYMYCILWAVQRYGQAQDWFPTIDGQTPLRCHFPMYTVCKFANRKKPCWPTFYLAPNTSAVDWWVPKNRHGSRKLSQKQRRRVLGWIGHTANPLSGNVQLFFTISTTSLPTLIQKPRAYSGIYAGWRRLNSLCTGKCFRHP
jgi:hypothetical protein